MSIAIGALGVNSPKVADYYLFWRELLRYKTDNLKGASTYYRIALDIYAKSDQKDQPKVTGMYYDVGVLYFNKGNIAETMKHLKECLL